MKETNKNAIIFDCIFFICINKVKKPAKQSVLRALRYENNSNFILQQFLLLVLQLRIRHRLLSLL